MEISTTSSDNKAIFIRGRVSGRELRILQVTAPGPVGGLESVVAALSLGLFRRGHAVTVSAALGNESTPSPFLDLLIAGGVPVVRVAGGYRAEGAALSRIAGEAGASLVHSHGYRSDVMVRLSVRRRGLPRVTTVHGFTGGGAKNRFYERLQLLALRGFDAVVPVSLPLARQLERSGVAARRLHLVPNAFTPLHPLECRAEARAKLALDSRGPVIGWVGRLSHEKGADVAVRALASLAGRDWVAVFLGDGPERPALERLAAEQGIAGRVRWMGNFAGAGAVMAAFDILLSSSRTEGTPMVLLEAAAAGVPIVATAVGGVPELLGPDEARSLAPAEDPVALAGRLNWLLEHPDLARRLGADQRDRLTAPSRFESWLDAYEDIYRDLLPR